MVSSGHMKIIFVDAFPSYQSHDALNRKGSSVYKISVEKVFVIWTWIFVKFKNIEKVIELSMNVTTNCELFFILNLIVD